MHIGLPGLNYSLRAFDVLPVQLKFNVSVCVLLNVRLCPTPSPLNVPQVERILEERTEFLTSLKIRQVCDCHAHLITATPTLPV